MLCIVLVYCNLAVIRALYAISAPRGSAPVVRRVSKSSCRQRARADGPAPLAHHNAATAEEVAFSRLMATLSVLFMICWLPQMVSSFIVIIIIVRWTEPASVLPTFNRLWVYLIRLYLKYSLAARSSTTKEGYNGFFSGNQQN